MWDWLEHVFAFIFGAFDSGCPFCSVSLSRSYHLELFDFIDNSNVCRASVSSIEAIVPLSSDTGFSKIMSRALEKVLDR